MRYDGSLAMGELYEIVYSLAEHVTADKIKKCVEDALEEYEQTRRIDNER